MAADKSTVFISWSGKRSKAVAEALREWLPDVFQSLEPFLSVEDIDKGAKWAQVISGTLARSELAILCLTPENLNSPWLLFEAGAVAKHDGSRVWTLLFDLAYTDVKDPLSQFQHTIADREDIGKLVRSVNKQLGASSLPPERLEKAFGNWWPALEAKLRSIPPFEDAPRPPSDPLRKLLEMTSEMLVRTRESSRERTFKAQSILDYEDRVPLSDLDRKSVV